MRLSVSQRARRFVAAGLVLSTALTLSACGGGGGGTSTSGDKKAGAAEEITFSYLWAGKEAEKIEQIIADFNASQSEVVVKGVSSPDQQGQLTSLTASKGSFDISDAFGDSVGSWASKGAIIPLDEILAANGVDTSQFSSAAMNQMTYDGKVYSMPIAVHTLQLVYNKTLLDEAGVAVPTTMDELAAAHQKLTKVASDGTIERQGLGIPDISGTNFILGVNFGGSWSDENGPTPTEPGNIKGLEWFYNTLIKPVGSEQYAAFKGGLGEYMSNQDPFVVGKYAMIIDGEWRPANLEEVAPDMEWGAVEIPYVTADKTGVTLVSTSTLFIPANSQHQEAAGKFLAYLLSDDASTNFALALGNLPAKLTILDRPEFAEVPYFNVWLDSLKSPNAFSVSSAPWSTEYGPDLKTAFEDVVLGSVTPTEALEKVQAKVSTYSIN